MGSNQDASLVIAALERCSAAIQIQHPEAPDALINVELRRCPTASFIRSVWITSKGDTAAITLSKAALLQPAAKLFAIFLHEVAHGLANARGLQDTSRQGRYHNKRYVRCAEEIGLVVGPRDEESGFANTWLHADTRACYEIEIASLERALTVFPNRQALAPHLVKPPQRVHVYCRCGRHLRLLLRTVKEGPLRCGLCGSPFLTKGRTARGFDSSRR
jgi:hypothetical protein